MAQMQQLDIYQMQDGFYVGRKCKNGKMAKGAYHITGKDIMTMFTQFFTDFCEDTHKTQMAMQDANGHLFVTSKVPQKEEHEKKE